VTIARAQLVDPAVSGIYHCISRCVRRAFLCGGGSSHRKDWIQQRLMHLATAFAIDVGGYAVLDNHFHTVLRTHPERADRWSPQQVVRRWFRVFPESIRHWARQIALAQPERAPAGRTADDLDDRTSIRLVAGDRDRIAVLRSRLASLSWFMKCLKERIARDANREDGCRGHFWEARFKSLRILDPAALLATLVYVDLNVIRALRAMTPESSEYTSVQDRIQVRQLYEKQVGRRRRAPRRAWSLLRRPGRQPSDRRPTMSSPEDGIWLAPIDCRQHEDGLLDLELDDYLAALDYSGRIVRGDKRGAIPEGLPPILERLRIDVDRWVQILRGLGRLFGAMISEPRERGGEAIGRGTEPVVGTVDAPPPQASR
jgi:hypothetical protein